MNKGMLIVISGPSGVGKGTIGNEILKRHKDNTCFSVSATTRKIRPGEKEGVHYFYKTHEEFNRMIENNEFLEYMQVFKKDSYGTPRSFVEEKRNAGFNVLLDIDVKGAMKVKANCPDALLIFIAPPSFSELRKRLVLRATETPEAVERRLAEAGTEMSYMSKYDFVVVNDVLADAVDTVDLILKGAEHSPVYNTALIDSLNTK